MPLARVFLVGGPRPEITHGRDFRRSGMRAKDNNRGDLPVTARTREEELREVPLWKANKGVAARRSAHWYG